MSRLDKSKKRCCSKVNTDRARFMQGKLDKAAKNASRFYKSFNKEAKNAGKQR